MSTKLPETKVLERKLDKLVKLQPRINKTMIKLNKVTAIPNNVNTYEKDIKKVVQNINKASDGSIKNKVAEKKSKKDDDKNLVKAALKTVVKETNKAKAKGDQKEAADVMKAVAKTTAQAQKAGATQAQTAVAVMKAVVKETAKKEGPEAAAQVVKELENSVQGKQKICGPGQDEIFDNCVKAQEKNDEDEDDSNSIAQTDS